MIARTGQGRKAFSFVADRSFAQNRLHTMTKKTVIDEELVRRAIGNTPSILDADPPPFDERIIKTVEDSDEAPQAAERRRRILLPDFERRFMARTEIRFRAAIYVDAETKRKILDVVRKIGPDRTIKMDVIWDYISAQYLGQNVDSRIKLYNDVQNMTLQDVIDYQNKWIKGRTYTYCILGDKKELDINALKKVGPVIELKQEDIFGY